MAYKGKSAFYIKDIFDRISRPSKKKQEILSKTIGASYPTGEGHRNWRKYKKIRTNIGDLYAGDYVKAVKKHIDQYGRPPTYEKDYVKWDSDNYNTTSKKNTTPGRMILDFGPRDYTTPPKEINIKVGEKTGDLKREIEMPVGVAKVKEKKHKSKFKYRTGGVRQKPKYLRKGKFIN